GRGDRSTARDARSRAAYPAGAAAGVLHIRGCRSRGTLGRTKGADPYGAGERAHHQGEAARAPRRDRQEVSHAFQPEEVGLEKALGDLRSVLVAGESIEAWAVQRRMFAVTHRRVLVAGTSGRLVVITRPLLGGFELVTVRWQDPAEGTLRVGVIGADLGIRAGKATDLASLGAQGAQRVELRGLRKVQAQAVYRICQ